MDTTADNGELPRPHAGLPVAGYRPQSDRAVATVNQVKQVEEQVLRLLDRLAADTALGPDGRWLAIGRTDIEKGFMAINRSIFRPARVDLAEHQGS